MGAIGEDRPRVVRGAIPFEDALRAFQDWHSRSIPIQVSFLGGAGFGEGMRASVDGLVTSVDPEGIVSVSGNGSEIKLDLRGSEFSYVNGDFEYQDHCQPLDRDSTLQLTFPSGAVCIVFPRRSTPSASDSKPTATGFEWLRNKIGRPGARRKALKDPPVDLPAAPPDRRNLLVDVRDGQANIVEIVHAGHGKDRIRRLREQFLLKVDGMRAERLKRQIVHGENGGSYLLSGMYRAKTESSFLLLLQLVEELERRDGSAAWDRRRFLR